MLVLKWFCQDSGKDMVNQACSLVSPYPITWVLLVLATMFWFLKITLVPFWHWETLRVFISILPHFCEDFLKGWEIINKLRNHLGWKGPLKDSLSLQAEQTWSRLLTWSIYPVHLPLFGLQLYSRRQETGPAQGKVYNAQCFSLTGQAIHFIREHNQVVQTPFIGISILVIPNQLPVFHLFWDGFQEESFHSPPRLTSIGIDSISRVHILNESGRWTSFSNL